LDVGCFVGTGLSNSLDAKLLRIAAIPVDTCAAVFVNRAMDSNGGASRGKMTEEPGERAVGEIGKANLSAIKRQAINRQTHDLPPEYCPYTSAW